MIGYVALAYTEYNVVRIAVYLEGCRVQIGPDPATCLTVKSYCAIASMVSRPFVYSAGLAEGCNCILAALEPAASARYQHMRKSCWG